MDDGVRLFRVRRTVLQMLRDRGFLLDHRELEMNIAQFKEKYTEAPQRDRLTILAEVHTSTSPSPSTPTSTSSKIANYP